MESEEIEAVWTVVQCEDTVFEKAATLDTLLATKQKTPSGYMMAYALAIELYEQES